DSRNTENWGDVPIVQVTVEGQMDGETSLSLGPAEGNDRVHLFDEDGDPYHVTGINSATLTVGRVGKKTAKQQSVEEEPDAYQLDLVEGEVIEQFDPDEGETYHKQDRFISATHVMEDEEREPASHLGRTYRSGGCEVAFSRLSFNPTSGESQVTVGVSDVDGCEGITLTYAAYELPDGTTEWISDRAHEQELKDHVTVTLEPGEEITLFVNVNGWGS
ncbi:MAG: hypothetical protein R3324_08395, partial [Halobacteriales archaeon]|nr:hypothetical protein [Halobacteriales archaeon]